MTPATLAQHPNQCTTPRLYTGAPRRSTSCRATWWPRPARRPRARARSTPSTRCPCSTRAPSCRASGCAPLARVPAVVGLVSPHSLTALAAAAPPDACRPAVRGCIEMPDARSHPARWPGRRAWRAGSLGTVHAHRIGEPGSGSAAPPSCVPCPAPWPLAPAAGGSQGSGSRLAAPRPAP